jgi:hypothetical protein
MKNTSWLTAVCLSLLLTVILSGCTPDIVFDPWQNPNAKADAFRLYYKERMERVLLAYNRFQLVNDVVPAHTLGSTYIDKQDARYDVLLHPVDNNEIGTSLFNTYSAWKVFGTRALELTLIRQFEGLAVVEGVSGIPGLTCREWQPGFTLTVDGPAGTVTRTRQGLPVEPGETFPSDLEAEILRTFFADGVFTYRGDPSETCFTLEPILNLGEYAVTFVFQELPRFLRVSDCCSSFMVSQRGPYAGYFWGSHNSRDNFPDLAIGYFAACAAQDDPRLSPDARASAARACAAGRRVGDSVLAHGYNLMTVSEFEPYDEDHLIVAGEIRPDGSDEGPEWLGSMNSCQMAYMAKALSGEGLRCPDERVENPGAYETLLIRGLFELLGLPVPEIVKTCRSIDDAYFGKTWEELLNLEINGTPFWDNARDQIRTSPGVFKDLLLKLANFTHQPEKSAFALVAYARTSGSPWLQQETRETLYRILEFQRRCARIVYDWAMEQPAPDPQAIGKAVEELQLAATYGHIAGVAGSEYDPFGFSREALFQDRFEGVLQRGDSTPLPLRTDPEIWAGISQTLEANQNRPFTYDRYWQRFPLPEDMPLQRSGDHYKAVGTDGAFHEIPNISHQGFGGTHLWDTLPMCALSPNVLDCRWAVLGCKRPDLDRSGRVDEADRALFEGAWATHGEGAVCRRGNQWCDGADLDRNHRLDGEDPAFLEAAMGCWY